MMETKFIERGRYMGNIDVPRSLHTMEIGETWHINPNLVNLRSVRNACSLMNTNGEKLFTVSCPGFSEPCITVKRLK